MKTITLRILSLAIILSASFVVGSAAEAVGAPSAWEEWARWVDRQHPVSDAQGHGPDIGSQEWAQALNRRLGIRNEGGKGMEVGSADWRKAVEKKLTSSSPAADGVTRDLLSVHETEARFEGLKAHRCMGLTSLCPDQCGHSGQMAIFKITRYLRYEKKGEYGDPKQEIFHILVEDNLKNSKIPPDIRDAVLALKPGDAVRLDWNHDYVTSGGSKYPERPVRVLVPLNQGPARAQ